MIRVSDLLAEPELGLRPLHLPDKNAEIRWVATSELVDPAPFLEGGEVLLTTGLETVGWRSQWRGYVERLVAARVVALGVGTGLTHRRPPAALVKACHELGLNLFEVPRDTAFVAISRAAARLIDQAGEAAARGALEAQRQLTQAALRPGDTSALLAKLADVVEGAAALLTSDGRLELGPFGPLRADLDPALLSVEVQRIRPSGFRAASSATANAMTTVVQPVGLTGRPTAYVAVLLPSRASEARRNAVTTAVALLSLAAESQNDRRDTERRLRSRALELLVHADARTARIVLAARAGLEPDDITLPPRIAMLRAAGSAELLDDALARLETHTELVARVGDEVWVVAAPGRTAAPAEALRASGLAVGVGSAVPLDDAASSHATAGHALASSTAGGPVVHWEEMVGEGAMTVLDPARAHSFAESFLAPLREDPSGELMPTLQSFLRHHGSRLKVAEELAIHRNTVRNRLEQIEAALGRSLDDPQVRVSAWIALQVGTTNDAG